MSIPQPLQQTARDLIKGIFIRDLFGRYTYNIAPTTTKRDEELRLLVLYGDNGSGKTTLLKLLYHALSTADRRGHKSFVAKTPFRELSIYFHNDTTLSCTRLSSSLTGSFRMRITQGSTLDRFYDFICNSEGAIPSSDSDSESSEYISFLQLLREITLTPFLLSDDRQLHSDAISDDPDILRRRNQYRYPDEPMLWSMSDRETMDEVRNHVLIESILRANHALRQRAIMATNKGAQSANTIYEQVIGTLTSGTSKGDSCALTTEDILARLDMTEKKNTQHSSLGLVPPLDFSTIRNAISSMTPNPGLLQIIHETLQPYLEGLHARLDALDPLRYLLTTFLESVNDLLVDKHVVFSVREGFQIYSTDGKTLEPTLLSSGERQLILLLTNVVSAYDHASLFMIDEPELSLNIKWQRRLLDILLALSQNSNAQFIIATHSIELLALHRDRRVRLRNIAGQDQLFDA